MRILTSILISSCLIALVYGWCQPGEFQCQAGTGIGCQQNDCLCLPGWRTTFPLSNNCEPICGDNMIVGNEECDGGVGCCNCQCRQGFVPSNPPSQDCVPCEQPPVPVCPPVQPPQNEPESQPQSEPENQPQNEPENQPQNEPENQPQNEPENQPQNEPENQPENQPQNEPENQPENQPQNEPENQPQNEPENQPQNEPEGQCLFRTYTQGAYGATCHGNNPACFLETNFGTCFPNGALVGRTGCLGSALFTSASAIEAFLPAGGQPRGITGTWTNPTNAQVPGVLAGQLLTALLNVGFDTCDSSFSSCTEHTQDLCFLDGNCEGFSVIEVISAAQYIISGCTTTGCSTSLPADLCGLSYSQINSCLDTFNNAFDGGRASSSHFGTCDTLQISGKATSDASTSAYCASFMLISATVALF